MTNILSDNMSIFTDFKVEVYEIRCRFYFTSLFLQGGHQIREFSEKSENLTCCLLRHSDK